MYRAGVLAKEIGRQEQLSRSSILIVLDGEGVPRQRRRMSVEQKKQARDLYSDGIRIAQIARQMNFDRRAVKRALELD